MAQGKIDEKAYTKKLLMRKKNRDRLGELNKLWQSKHAIRQARGENEVLLTFGFLTIP